MGPIDALEEIEREAVVLAEDCGRMAAEFFRSSLDVQYKAAGRRDPVTEADRAIEDYVRDAVGKRFPAHRVLGEERPDVGPPDSDFVWAVDPVDGTVNFAAGLPIFSVSVGLLHRGAPVVGAMYLSPGIAATPGVIHARRNGGCFFGDCRLSAFGGIELHPSYPVMLPAAFWRRFDLKGRLKWTPIEIRTLGSIAHELAFVAAGAAQFGAYLAPHIWDVAAGILLVQEAGGGVYCWESNRWKPFERFRAPRRSQRRDGGQLRDWHLPLLAGGNDLVASLTSQLQPRSRWRARLWPAVWRLLGG